MGKNPVIVPHQLNQKDFEIPSATRAYPIGLQMQVIDDSNDTTKPYVSVYEYHQAGTTMQQYGTYTIRSTGSGVVCSSLTNSVTSVGVFRTIVPQTNVTNGYYFFGAVKGICTVAATSAAGQDIWSKGKMLKLANAATSLSVHTAAQSSATTPSVIRQVKTVGFSSGLAASGSNFTNIYLFGDPILSSRAAKEPI
jgi:hypothetical protein